MAFVSTPLSLLLQFIHKPYWLGITLAIFAFESLAQAQVFRVTGGGLVAEAALAGPVPPPGKATGLQPAALTWRDPATQPPMSAPAQAPVLAPPADLRAHFAAAADRYDLSESLLTAVAWTESRYHTNATSPAGARGLMQLMPATARSLGVSDRSDPSQNVMGGARYLRAMLDRFGNNLEFALAGYNAGPSAVQRYGGIPPYRETRAYVRRVIARLADEAAAEAR